MKIKKSFIPILLFASVGLLSVSCGGNKKQPEEMKKTYAKGTFGYDLDYLSEKDSALILLKSDDEKGQLILSAKYQAKVFTSTANGLEANSHGFVNYDFFDAGLVDEHMNGFGGENRFWLGPEGGLFSIFFKPGEEQIYENWHTPKAIDIEEWDLKSVSSKEAIFTKEMLLNNFSGTQLNLLAERRVALLSDAEVKELLDIHISEAVNSVAYTTLNSIKNNNDFEWSAETGTVCVWMLDMYKPSDSAVTIIPYNQGIEGELGRVVTSDYFGEIPAERLIDEEGVVYFKTDGEFRGKLGMNAKRSTAVAGNYDPISRRLTIVTFDLNSDAVYLNQEWNPDRDPLVGDALNAYNDGPLEDGTIMGPFLELESSSAAAFLAPGESLRHTHNIYHFVGDESDLELIAERVLGVSLNRAKNIF